MSGLLVNKGKYDESEPAAGKVNDGSSEVGEGELRHVGFALFYLLEFFSFCLMHFGILRKARNGNRESPSRLTSERFLFDLDRFKLILFF